MTQIASKLPSEVKPRMVNCDLGHSCSWPMVVYVHTKPHRVNFIKISHANNIKNNILQVVHNKILKAHDLKVLHLYSRHFFNFLITDATYICEIIYVLV